MVSEHVTEQEAILAFGYDDDRLGLSRDGTWEVAKIEGKESGVRERAGPGGRSAVAG